MSTPSCFVAFAGTRLLHRGTLAEIAEACKREEESATTERLAIFEDETGRVRDLDLSGTLDDVRTRFHEPEQPLKKRGRPKLGVISREISLLPRHWDWLADQRGGASAALRRLVDNARKSDSGASLVKRALEAAHAFMWDIASSQANFEEATRHLYAHRFDRFETEIADWPPDLRAQIGRYVERARVAQVSVTQTAPI